MSRPDAEFPGGENRNNSTASSARYQANAKSMLAAYVLWFFLGWLGLHRFYLGRPVSAIIMFLMWAIGTGITALLFGFPLFLAPWALWMFIDLFLIPGMTASENNAVVDRMEGRR